MPLISKDSQRATNDLDKSRDLVLVLIRNSLYAFLLGIFFVPMVVLGKSQAHAEEACEKLWIADSSFLVTTSSERANVSLINKWREREKECESTSVYWGRLATMQALINDFDAARDSLRRAPTTTQPEFTYAADFAGAVLFMQERLAAKEKLNSRDLVSFESRFSEVVRKHPRWPTGYAMLGAIQTLQDKHAQAIGNLNTALSGDRYQLFGVHRNLAVSYAALGQYEQSIKAGDKAVELNPKATSDPVFLIAMAVSHAELGYFADAEDMLKLVSVRSPEYIVDSDYKKAADVAAKRRREAMSAPRPSAK
jgi:tetratricopeptide (TPR) repeat protein